MLTLTVLRCPPSVAPQTRRVEGGEITIGRGQECDWTLPDPERHLSKRHCVVTFHGGGWRVEDCSSNGTYLNREDVPIGPAAPRPLRDGDRLRFGAYEIEVSVAADRPTRTARTAPDPFDEGTSGDGAPWPRDDRPFPWDDEEDTGPPVDSGPSMPHPVFPPRHASGDGRTTSDHTPEVEDPFSPPRPASPSLPADWSWEEPDPKRPVSRSPEPFPPVPFPPVPTPERPAASPSPVVRPAPVAPDGAGDPMAAFLRGAGLPGAQPADPAAAMEALGQAFRAFVAGLRGAMIARATVKGEFRIEQTMVRARGNNPLKFSAGDDDALAALLGVGRHVDMTPAQAVAEALDDVRLHELATAAAMRAAVHALLARFDPAALRRTTDAEAAGALAVLPAQRKARAWDAYERLHAATARALRDDFDAVFGKAFALAYEKAARDARGGDRT